LAVEVLSTKIVKNHEESDEYHREIAKVRVVSSLKDTAPWLPGEIVSAQSIYLFEELSVFKDEHLVPGRRYIVFAANYDMTRLVTKDLPLIFERCGLQEDTPEIRHELEKGFAQNDTLRP
jgi:hypothetical protein